MGDLETEARRLYDECPTVKTDWEDLGAATQSVWLEYAERSLAANEEMI